MASPSTIVLVTGANQGIGYAIVKSLATDHPDYHIVLGSRSASRGAEAVSSLNLPNVSPLTIDLNSDDSITSAFTTIASKFGKLDVLINNAAISRTDSSSTSYSDVYTDAERGYSPSSHPQNGEHSEHENGEHTQHKATGDGDRAAAALQNKAALSRSREIMLACYNTNVIGTLKVTDAAIELLKKAKVPRIVFVGSGIGSMARKLDASNFEHLVDLPAYTLTKAATNMLAAHYIVRFKDWKINVVCPGYTATNLNSYQGTHSPDVGAISACRMATVGKDGPTGTFTDKDGPLPW